MRATCSAWRCGRAAFVPGSNCVRLDVSHSTPEMIDDAVARLGRALQAGAP
jgi:DNA-binding transcriptional MocR family regulator